MASPVPENPEGPRKTPPLQRRFSDVMRTTLKRGGEELQKTVQDVSNIMDVGMLIETTLVDSQEGPSAKSQQVIEQQKKAERTVVTRDTIAFFLGVVNVALIGFWMGRHPQTYYHYWALKSVILFSWRWHKYRQKGWQYLMLELCYFGNFLGILHVYVWPHNVIMRKLAFAVCAGPLMWSIMAMRNSLVFHDIDKMTTLMMHASPALAGWSLRWYPDDHYRHLNYAEATWMELVFTPIIFYVVWVNLYYYLCFVLLKDRIKKKGGVTMFDIMVPKDPAKIKKNPILRFLMSFPPAWQPVVYLACHGTLASASFIPTYLFWNHFVLHTCALLFCLALSVWNGGTFYFKVFAKRYQSELEERSQHHSKRV